MPLLNANGSQAGIKSDIIREAIITVEDLEETLSTQFNPVLRSRVELANLRYETLTQAERDTYLLDVIEELIKSDVVKAGPHRRPQWEIGWAENLAALQQGCSLDSIIPRYHGKHRLVHWRQDIVRPLIPHFDYWIHAIIVDWAIETFLKRSDHIFEFGCGPAYHLLRIRKINPTVRLVGLDWTKTSQDIIAQIVKLGIANNIEGRNFDFYHPDGTLCFPPNSGIYTVAALEQVGDQFDPFLQFLLRKRPQICVHLEPLEELMDSHHLIDRLSVLYFRKRNYLRGFLTRLHELRDQGRITIHREQRTYTGSYFIEGHSLVVWSPN
jgi:hypothetical protein